MTYGGTTPRRPAILGMPRPRAVSAGGGRCWVRTNAGSEPVDKASGGLLILSGWRGAAFAAPSPDRGRAGLVPGEPACHDHYCGPVDHGLVMFDPTFVVADQAPVAHQPAEGALDDPPAADDLETGQVAALDDLQRDAGGLPDPGGQRLAVIAADRVDRHTGLLALEGVDTSPLPGVLSHARATRRERPNLYELRKLRARLVGLSTGSKPTVLQTL